MSKPEPTERPWMIFDLRFANGDETLSIVSKGRANQGRLDFVVARIRHIVNNGRILPEDEENAKLIVLACNNFERVLSALKRAHGYLAGVALSESNKSREHELWRELDGALNAYEANLKETNDWLELNRHEFGRIKCPHCGSHYRALDTAGADLSSDLLRCRDCGKKYKREEGEKS